METALGRRLASPLLLAPVLALALIAPWPALAADPLTPTTYVSTVKPNVDTVSVNLYRPYAVARQFTSYWCVPANAQTMLNLVTHSRDRSYRNQARYAWHIHRLNRYRYVTAGNDVAGWASFLDQWMPGDLHYAARAYDTRAEAIAAIVDAIDRTGHPVGIVVDRGRHAWTVVGYRALVPRAGPRTIIGLYVAGSLSASDPWPYRYLNLDQFGVRYTRYHEWQRRVVWEGKFVTVSE